MSKQATIPDLSNPPYADYVSPGQKPGLFSRCFPTAGFYGRVAKIVLGAAHHAKRGRFGDADWYGASLSVRKAFEKVGAKVSIRGTEHFANIDGPCVFIGNHMSTAETFLLASIIRPFNPVTFVVKQSLVEYPIFKHIMLSRDPIVVGRVNPREDLKAVMGGGKERLEGGTSIIIFPQRTRTVKFEKESFNTIGVKLAKRAGVPIIPLALKTNAWANGKLFKDYGRFQPQEPVNFEFGPPIQMDGNDRAAHEAVISFIESRLTEWGVPVA